MAKKKKVNWYNINDLMTKEFNTPVWQYALVFSGRGRGKSYSTYKYLIDKYFEDKSQGMILKRFESDMKGSRVSGLFSALEPYVWDTYQMKIRYYRNAFYFYIPTEENKIPPLSECELFCYTGALNISDRLKGMNYPDVKTIVVEEIHSINGRYLPDEPILLMNIVSTVFRHRTDDRRVIMLSNCLSRFDPYSRMLGIKLHELKHGTIRKLSFKDKKGHQTNFIIHRAENVDVLENDENEANVSFSNWGDNELGASISDGEFQDSQYPRQVFGYFIEETSETEYDRLINHGHTLIGKFTEEDNLPVYFKFDNHYYQVRLKYPKTDKDFFKLRGHVLMAFVEVSEKEFIHQHTAQKGYFPFQVVITPSFEFITNQVKHIIITNLYDYECPVSRVNDVLNLIRQAFHHHTVCYLTNEIGNNVNQILLLQSQGGM